MIQYYHNTLPVCILPFSEHGIDINLEEICSIIEALEPTLLSTYTSDTPKKDLAGGYWKADDGEIITRWNKYNLLLLHHPTLFPLFLLMMRGINQFNKIIRLGATNQLYLQSWATLTRKNKKIEPHLHSFNWIGHIAIRAEPSTTILRWLTSENEEKKVEIENKNGQLILSPNVNHLTSVWLEDEPRITIAFDIINDDIWHNPIHMDKIKPPMFPIHLQGGGDWERKN